MRKFGLIVVGVCLTATMALGADGEPKKANGFKSTLVNAYPACTVPTEFTAGVLPIPACPAVDPSPCTFGAKGSGKVSAKTKTDVAVQAQLGGLENCPDGTTLIVSANFSAATNNCTVSTRCTTVALTNFTLGTCTVAKGKCKVKTTVNTQIPNAIVPGKNTAITINGVGVGTGTSAVAAAGVLVL
ncbi:MAG: hypothetical protein ABI629_16235 [bacterium]